MGILIKDSRVIITGGANGIGFMCVRHLLLKGAKAVIILDLDASGGNAAVNKLNAEFGKNRAAFITTNVANADEFEAAFKKAVQNLGGLDIMINNAGILDDSRWSLMIDINVKGVVNGTLMALAVMGKHKGGKGGTILNMGSVCSFISHKYVAGYVTTKHAVLGFTRSIAMSYSETGVEVKTMCPGSIDTSLLINEAPRYFEHINLEEAHECMRGQNLLKPETIAEVIMRFIEETSNGAVWVSSVETSTISLNIPHFTEWGTRI